MRSTQSLEAVLQTMMADTATQLVLDRLPNEPEALATQPPLVATHHPAVLMMRTWFGVEADHLQEINVISLAISEMEMGLWTLVR
jgi:hypothetical protein